MRILHVAAASALLVLAACSGDGGTSSNPGANPPPAGTASVAAGATSNEFSPSDVSIAVGGSVLWTFGARAHNVVFASVAGAPANIPATSNAQVSRTFSTQGTFPYDCMLHPGMRGRVLVGVTDNSPPPGY